MVQDKETQESEVGLIERAQVAVSRCNWEVGECAAIWTRRFAKGRTDADFANLVGLSADQVYQRRRVWETFGDVSNHYDSLKWSHFYSAINWDDAAECLQWANDTQATVAEMKAWRRAQRGEDLTEAADDFQSDLAAEPVPVRWPDDAEAGTGTGGSSSNAEGRERDPQLSQAARELGESGDDYAPFHSGVVVPPGSSGPAKSHEPPSAEQIVRRAASMLERCAQSLTEEVLSEWDSFPNKVRERLSAALEELQDRLSQVAR
ncbi:MAG: hypothetical protein KF777_13530 [Planctomycetaceae bacterium]|nr:hypothetical protein [Planctomycetaceae bacterium]